MSDETTNQEAPEGTTGVEDPATPEEFIPNDGDPAQPEDGQAQPAEEELEEVERDGKVYRVPKALKDELLMHADYTKKTQELADQRRAAQAEQMRFGQANAQHVQAMAQLMNLDGQIAGFQNMDWQRLSDEDPVQAQKLFVQFSQLKDARQQMAGYVQQMEQAVAFDMQQATARQVEEGRATLSREIPNWSKETADQLTSFAVKEFGFQPHEVNSVLDPRQVKVLHLAWLGHQLLKQQKSGQPAAPAVKPAPSVSGKSSGSRDMGRMTTDEWMRARNAQVRTSKGK